MKNRSPVFYGGVVVAIMLAIVLGTLLVKEATYLAQLTILDVGTSATVDNGRLTIPTFDIRRTDQRPIDYYFMVDDTQYYGTAIDDGQSTNQIAIRYAVDNPTINVPARLDTGAEKAGILLRIAGIIAVTVVGVISVVVIRRKINRPVGPYTVGRL